MAIVYATRTRWSMLLWWLGWSCVTFFVIFKSTTQTNYAVLSPSIAQAFGLSIGEIGILGSIYIAGFSLMTIPSGALLDYYGARRWLTFGVVTVVLGALLFASAPTWWVLCTGQFVMGLGGAFGYPALGYVTRHYFGDRRFALMMGFASTVSAVFATLTQGGVATLVEAYSWRDITFGLAAIGAGLAFIAWLVIDDSVTQASRATGRPPFFATLWRDLRAIAVIPRLWGCGVVSGVFFACYLGIGVVWGVQLFLKQGYDETTAGHLSSLIFIGGAVGPPCIALLTERLHSYKRPTLLYFAGAAIALVLLCGSSSASAVYSGALIMIVGFFASCSAILGFAYAMRLCDVSMAGMVTAFVNFVLFVVSGIMMAIPGMLLDLGVIDSLATALLLFPATLIVTGVLVAILYREDVFPPGTEVAAP